MLVAACAWPSWSTSVFFFFFCCEIMFKAWKKNTQEHKCTSPFWSAIWALFDFGAEWFLLCLSLKGPLKSRLCPGLQRIWIQLPWQNLGVTFRKVLNFQPWQPLLLYFIFINKLKRVCVIPEYKGPDIYIFPVRSLTRVSPLQQWFGGTSGPKKLRRLFVMMVLGPWDG